MLAAVGAVNFLLAILTYLTWCLGVWLCSGRLLLRPGYLMFWWLWLGYTVIYACDALALLEGFYYTKAYLITRLCAARLTILGAVWRAIWAISGPQIRCMLPALWAAMRLCWWRPWRLRTCWRGAQNGGSYE